MKINSEVVGVMNAKQDDLNVEVGLFKNLRNLNKIAGEELPSLPETIQQFEKRLRTRLEVDTKDEETLIEEFNKSVQNTHHKMKVFLTMDANSATLKRVGATDKTLKELEKIKDKLQQELFSVYNLTEDDFKPKEIVNE